MTDFYSQVDQNGRTGQPGQVKSYDCGYMTTSNVQVEAQEAGFDSIEEYLRSWWNEVSTELPWTWETLGNGYGYHGSTIFTNQEPDGGTLRCKEIYDQIMFDVYPPQAQPQADQPIEINESDIKAMIFEGACKILNEEYGTAYGHDEWMPFSEFDEVCKENNLTEDVAEELIQQGVVPEDLNRDFLIQASCSRRNMFDYSTGPSSDDGEMSFYGEYDEAVALIEQVKDPKIQEVLRQSLDATCASIVCDDFQPDEPDPDEWRDSRMDMDEIDGSYQKLPFEEPQPTEPTKQWGGICEGREYDTWLGHSDIPGSDGRFFNIVFYLDQNGQINYRCNGDSNQTNPEPYMPKPGGWLDQQIRRYMETHIGEIKANLFI